MSFGVTGLGHTGITVSDLSRSLRFWEELLGFQVVLRTTLEPPFASGVTGVADATIAIALLEGHGHSIELLEYTAPAGRSVVKPAPNDVGSFHVAVIVDDIARALDEVQDHGYVAVGPPQQIRSGPRKGGWAVYTRDEVDGTIVELLERPDGSSA